VILYLLGAALVGFVVWTGIGVWRIGRVSRGPVIGKRPNTAVLLIDLQMVFWDSDQYDAATKANVEQVIKTEVSRAKSAGVPVIALRQEWSIPSTKIVAKLMMNGDAIAGSNGTELAPPFVGLSDHVLVKRVQDAFETGELDAILKRLDVGKLRILGLDGNYCVAITAQAARRRGFEVEIVSSGVLIGDKAKYERVLETLDAVGVSQV